MRELATESDDRLQTNDDDTRRGQKAVDAYRTISEVAVDMDLPQHVLRFWESKFKQIAPMKRAGGRRFYRPQDIDLIKRIHYLLYTQGYTIKGVQKLLAKDRHLVQSVPHFTTAGATVEMSVAVTQTPRNDDQPVQRDLLSDSAASIAPMAPMAPVATTALHAVSAARQIELQNLLKQLKALRAKI